MAAEDAIEMVGEVEEVVFENPEKAYAVLRLAVPGLPLPVTITGTLFGLGSGSRVRVVGRYRDHRRFGRQLHVERYEELRPASRQGMVRFLASQFHGIGERSAERIVEHFGDAAWELLDSNPARVAEVKGIGRKTAKGFAEQWQARKPVREVMTFLQGYGVGPGQVMRVFRAYGDEAVSLVRSNPYRLADDVRGIGFRTADRIASGIGVPKDSPERARAALLHVLNEAAADGHLLLPERELLRLAGELEVDEQVAVNALADLVDERFVVREAAAPAGGARRVAVEHATGAAGGEAWDRAGPVVALPRFHAAECEVAARIARRAARGTVRKLPLDGVQTEARTAGLELAPEQAEAIAIVLEHDVAVITGGPGVGKTTITKLLVQSLKRRGAAVLLAAPTGRAAKRLSEATGHPAATIHRLLRFDPRRGVFQHDDHQPLAADHVIVDECSMLDVPLAAALARALPDAAALTLVGDADQLPSVGPGDLLRALCASGAVPVARLRRVFRQREGSRIVEAAHAIDEGRMPPFDPPGAGGEIFFVERDDPQEVAETVRLLVAERIPAAYGLEPLHEVQVLTPMHRGATGAENLNVVLGAALNPHPAGEFERGGRKLRTGDRVVQTRNDYDREVFNGDQGFVTAIDAGRRELFVRFDDDEVRYSFDDADALLPAFATTVHRAQGGEHKAVVLALVTQHFPLLKRNLVYTAVTRARRLCVIVGQRRALEIAIRNASEGERCSWLEERLRAAAAEGAA